MANRCTAGLVDVASPFARSALCSQIHQAYSIGISTCLAFSSCSLCLRASPFMDFAPVLIAVGVGPRRQWVAAASEFVGSSYQARLRDFTLTSPGQSPARAFHFWCPRSPTSPVCCCYFSLPALSLPLPFPSLPLSPALSSLACFVSFSPYVFSLLPQSLCCMSRVLPLYYLCSKFAFNALSAFCLCYLVLPALSAFYLFCITCVRPGLVCHLGTPGRSFPLPPFLP